MSPEDLNMVCDAIDAVKSFSAQSRKTAEREAKELEASIQALDEALSLSPAQDHALIIRLGELEAQAEEFAVRLSTWSEKKAEAGRRLNEVVGLGVSRTVSPEVHRLIQQLSALRRPRADGSMGALSLSDIALATGLSEGTVSKLRSGTYPASTFPATVKRGRRAAAR